MGDQKTGKELCMMCTLSKQDMKALQIEVKDLSKSFGEVQVISHFSYTFKRGIYVISSPSGAGKTTLLRIVCGLDEQDSGEVIISPHTRVVMMFQEDRLLENLSVMANILLARPERSGSMLQTLKNQIIAALDAVDLMGFQDRPVNELSGGQKRRVALLRTLFTKADVLLFDEPLKGLDKALKDKVISVIKPYLTSKIVIWVTHTPEEAKLLDSAHYVQF